MTAAQSRVVIIVVAIAVVVLIVVGTRYRRGPSQPPAQPTRPAAPAPAPPLPPKPRAATTAAPPPASRPAPPAPVQGQTKPTQAQVAAALAKFNQGVKLLGDGDLLAARSALADALNTGALPTAQAQAARDRLTELAQKTLFSRRVIPGDPCTFPYKFKAGDRLVRVERAMKLHVPDRLILLINGIPDAAKIRAGETLKMVRGPFHAVVSKGRFTMDVYLEEPKTARMIFVRRFRVGTGKDGSTPLGRWRVALGKKMERAAWTPPLSSDLPQRKILWGQPGYPLGRKGYWISIEGIEDNHHTAEDGYGIHGTHDRSSIGRASSMGCIRLTDEDIEQVFAMLYEHWSTVTVIR